MDINRKKQLLEEYKNRRPEKGVIAYRCKETGESFLGASKDTRSDFNSNYARLSMNCHPNKRFQELWNTYGEAGFEQTVLKVLKYENTGDNHTSKLEKMRDECLEADPRASKLWR